MECMLTVMVHPISGASLAEVLKSRSPFWVEMVSHPSLGSRCIDNLDTQCVWTSAFRDKLGTGLLGRSIDCRVHYSRSFRGSQFHEVSEWSKATRIMQNKQCSFSGDRRETINGALSIE